MTNEAKKTTKADDKPDNRTPEVIAAYAQGREARANAIGYEDAPHGEGAALKEWRRGWNDQDKAYD